MTNMLALDMTLYRDNNGTVSTKTHFKPHNKFLYVSPLFNHPSHTWRALVRGELLRIHRACSSRQIAFSHARFLADRFENRGFDRRLTWKTYDEISRLPSSSILVGRQCRVERHIFTTRYHRNLACLPRLIRKLWHETRQSGPPPMIAWQRRSN